MPGCQRGDEDLANWTLASHERAVLGQVAEFHQTAYQDLSRCSPRLQTSRFALRFARLLVWTRLRVFGEKNQRIQLTGCDVIRRSEIKDGSDECSAIALAALPAHLMCTFRHSPLLYWMSIVGL